MKEIINSNLEQQFAQIRTNRPEFDRSQLPDDLELPFNQEFSSQNLVELATAFWQRVYSEEEFVNHLRKYLRTPTDQRSQLTTARKYFKQVRKAGLIYKSAFRFGDERRDVPGNFDQFLKELGELGDYYQHSSGRKTAFSILNLVSTNDFWPPEKVIQPTTETEALARVSWIVEKCQKLLADKEVTVVEFHKMRKLIRHLMNIFQLAAVAKWADLNLQQTFQFVCDLNSLLGDEHDEAVNREVQGLGSYQEHEVKLTSEMTIKVAKLLEKLDHALAERRSGQLSQGAINSIQTVAADQ